MVQHHGRHRRVINSPKQHPWGPHGRIVSHAEAMSQYAVNREGWEAITQSLYDSAVYPAAGSLQLNFFAVPVGQGVGFGGGVKTLSDTNMQLASNIPNMQEFLVRSIEIEFQPTTPTVAAGMPAAFGAQAVDVLVNDVYIFYRSGNLRFFVGSKDYLNEAPIMRFPPSKNFALHAAVSDATTAGANFQSRIAFAKSIGRVYHLAPYDILLESNQNFGLQLNWPEGLQAITNPARVFARLDGILYRRSQ